VPVENLSDRSGSDVVQVYVTNHASSCITPVRELRGFERVSLDGGEHTTAEITLDAAELGQVGEDGTRQTEAGEYSVRVGNQTIALGIKTNYD
jgi:beta-glucosidase